ncbi:MAG: aminotransferase class V-fold PLP-dependent enzyme, partial [Candidatus Fimimonas sp.]
KGEVLLHMLEQFEIIVGTGSACSSKNKQSRIAKAIGLAKNFTEGVLRISFCKYNTVEETEMLAEKLRSCVLQLRKTMLG